MKNSKLKSKLLFIKSEPNQKRFENPIVLIHGAFHGAWMWEENFIPYFLDAGFDVYAINFNNQNRLFASINDFVNELKQLLIEFDEEPILIAHSMGGLIAQKFLETQKAKAAILMSSVPPYGMHKSMFKLVNEKPFDFLKFSALFVHPVLTRLGKPPKGVYSDKAEKQDIRKMASGIKQESWRVLFELLNPKIDIQKVKETPLLILGAENDGLVFKGDVLKTAEMYGIKPKIYAEMPHHFTSDPNWRIIADEILLWLKNEALVI